MISNCLAFIVSNRESTGIGKPNKNPMNNTNKIYYLLKLLHSYVGSCSVMIGSWRNTKVSNDIFTFSVMLLPFTLVDGHSNENTFPLIFDYIL